MKRIAIIVAIALAGCQTTKPVVPPDPGVACIRSLADKPMLAGIKSKVYLSWFSSTQPFELLTNNTKANDSDKVAIAKWVDGSQICFNETEQWLVNKGTPPNLTAIYGAAFSKFQLQTAALYNDKLTYGEYAKARQIAFTEASAQWNEEVQRQREMQAAAEAQRRRLAAMYMLSQHPYQVPVPQPTEVPAPIRTTTCSVVGNEMDCTTE